MAVAPETIIEALKELESLEKFSLENLMEISRDPLTPFTKSLRQKMLTLLDHLKEDTGEHQELILKIIRRLKDAGQKQKSHS